MYIISDTYVETYVYWINLFVWNKTFVYVVEQNVNVILNISNEKYMYIHRKANYQFASVRFLVTNVVSEKPRKYCGKMTNKWK